MALDQQEMAELFGSTPPDGKIDMRDYLAQEKKNVMVNGCVQETIYIGTDTRYRVS